jgi:hypothetical protein
MAQRLRRKRFFLMRVPLLFALCSMRHSLDDLGAFFVQKLVTAIGAEKLDLFVAKLLIVAVELAAALRAGHPENFSHNAVLRKQDSKSVYGITIESHLQIGTVLQSVIPACF